jgi:PadR family transcriptional regulator PadR
MTADRSQWLRGVTDLLVLGALSAGPSYGYALVEHLRDAGLSDLNEATVYGALRRLEADGLLASELVRSTEGPARRYFSLTAAGTAARDEGIAGWQAFVRSVAAVVDLAGGRRARPRSAS